MCNFFSAIIVDKNRKALWDPDIDSHTELLTKFNLKDETTSPNFVRVELLPPYGDVFNHDLKTWKFKTDQDFRPDWYNEEEAFQTTREAVSKLIDERFIINRMIAEIKDGRWWLESGGTIEAVSGGTIEVVSGGTIQVVSGGTIQAVRGGTIEAVSGGTIEAVSGGTIQVVSGGTIEAVWGGTIQAVSGGTIQAVSGGTIGGVLERGIVIYPADKKIVVADPKMKIVRFKAKKVKK